MNPYERPAAARSTQSSAEKAGGAAPLEDPVLVSARREAVIVLALWAAAFAWTVGYCARYGYQPEPRPPLVLGIPSWIMWGIFVPWTVCTVLSTLLAWLLMTDDDLGEDPDELRSELEAAREVGDG